MLTTPSTSSTKTVATFTHPTVSPSSTVGDQPPLQTDCSDGAPSPVSAYVNALADHLNARCDSVGENALSAPERVCADAWFLHIQVYRGGYWGWFDNGYADRAAETLSALIAIGANNDALRLQRALDVVWEAEGKRRRCRDDDDSLPRRRIYRWESRRLAALDLEYYAQEESFLYALEQYARGATQSTPEAFPGFSAPMVPAEPGRG